MKTTKTPKHVTQAQVRYAKNRIESAREVRKKAIVAEFDASNRRGWGAASAILDAEIRAGRFKVPTKNSIQKCNAGTDLYKVLVFTRYPRGMEDAEAQVERATNRMRARLAAVNALADQYLDALVLGPDPAAALASIQQFEVEISKI